MARRKAFLNDAVADERWFDYPEEWWPEVRVLIRRTGVKAWRDRMRARMRNPAMLAVFERIADSGASLADFEDEEKRKEILGSLRLDKMEGEALLDAMTDELDYEGIAAVLVREIDGPLVQDDDGNALPWTGDAEDAQFLADNPVIARWFYERADELQREYNAFVNGANASLDSTSAPLAGAPEEETEAAAVS